MIALLAARALLARGLLVGGAVLSRTPAWAYCVVAGLLATAGAYHLGRTHEVKLAAAAMVEYKSKQAVAAQVIVEKEVQVVTRIEVQYRDRIQKIYVQGVTIEKEIPNYIRPVDDLHFGVNAGFVRVVDGAWSGRIDGPAEDADRESSGVPLDQIAAVEVGNATSCRAWRDKVIGWRQFYAEQQGVVNGKIGDWYQAEVR